LTPDIAVFKLAAIAMQGALPILFSVMPIRILERLYWLQGE
jgi:TRAP-type C4-dicarboxylate transport system permease small subunit